MGPGLYYSQHSKLELWILSVTKCVHLNAVGVCSLDFILFFFKSQPPLLYPILLYISCCIGSLHLTVVLPSPQASLNLPKAAAFDPYAPRVNFNSKTLTANEEFAVNLKKQMYYILNQPVGARPPLTKTGNNFSRSICTVERKIQFNGMLAV